MGQANAVGEALDRLYAAPLDGFVELRRELARALRGSGDIPASRAVASATKPSRTAWAVNQVVRRHPELVAALLDAHGTASATQTKGDSEAVRVTARAYRDRVADVVQSAGAMLREAGAELSVAQGRRIAATIRALVGAESAEAREKLLVGRLVADEEADDPFAGMSVAPVAERAARAAVQRPRTDDLAVRRAAAERERAAQREREKKARDLAIARDHVAAIEREAQDARAAARQAEVAAVRAQSEAERARRAVDAVEQRLDEARRGLRALST
jgi:hypothetical protein